jgi:molybdate-binding protein
MTRYLDLSTDLATAVRSGELAPGAELPSVRDLATARATTAATVSRAYRHLADSGVLRLESRRRARVSEDGPAAARRLLGGTTTFRLAGSDDPAMSLLLRHLGDRVSVVPARGSLHGLAAVASNVADGATAHLRHHTGVYNAPFAAGLLRGLDPHLIHLWRREQGFLVQPGNPTGITGVADLLTRRTAMRAAGTGTRVLIDRLLRAAGADPDAVRGPQLGTHLEVALAVATGAVDVGVGVRSAAADLDLDFLHLAWEDYDIALPGAALGRAAPLVTALRDSTLRKAVESVGGYDTTRSGAVQQICR